MKLPRRLLALFVLFCAAQPASADKITSAVLRIQGAGLELVVPEKTLTLGVDMSGTVQTKFGGAMNDQAPNAGDGVVAVAELTGPGLETPIQLVTAPGYKFQIPGLPKTGTYYLQNVRLMNGTEFLQYASPAAMQFIVADLLNTTVTVRQLTAQDLRDRGITIDARNFDVYEYSFTFIIDGEKIEIPFPVVVDPRTHEVQPVAKENPYNLPSGKLVEPPRWSPPQIIPLAFKEDPFPGEDAPPESERKVQGKAPSIPAAIVIPNSLSVLHQFFGVVMMVTNGAPLGTATELHDIRATIRIPTALRTVKTEPQVSFGQAVPIVEPVTGATFLIAQGRGEAEWTLEGLKPGTHRIDFDLRATLKQQGQTDLPMRATPSAAVVVHDPRFNINFSHPNIVREGIDYSTYMFITNMSGTDQQLTVRTGIPKCGPPTGNSEDEPNVCRLNGEVTDLITIPANDMRMVEYRLRPGVTGQVIATAGSIDNPDNISASVGLHLGVSPEGIPLSPATLIMPHYAQYMETDLVSMNLQLLGLGYSLATAPLNQMTAKFPRVIKSDVFQRAVDVSRAGQRIFITDSNPASKRDSLANLTLDLVGNGGFALEEWDELRRMVKSGRLAGAATMRELEATSFIDGASMNQVVDAFAAATAHRGPYLAALAHGGGTDPRPYAVKLTGVTSARETSLNNETEEDADHKWVRGLPWSDLSSFNGGGEKGELALMGRWTEDIDVTVTPSATGPFTLDILYPDTEDGRLRHARFSLTGTANHALTVRVTRGADSLSIRDSVQAIVSTVNASSFGPAPLRIEGARQDLYLDKEAHKVSVLFNRPVETPEGVDLRTKFTGKIDFNKDGVVYNGPRPISAAALQDDGRTINLTFDHALSTNAAYTIETGTLHDPAAGAPAIFSGLTVPKIDNNEPAGIVYGHVIKGDNTPVAGADVIIRQYLPDDTSSDPKGAPQYDVSKNDGAFLFEFVRRDIQTGWTGQYRLEALSTVHKRTSVEGSVRLPREVHFVTLQYLGRGAAEGYVRYNDGTVVAGADVVIGSTMFSQFRTTRSDASGKYVVEDLPVGPLTFSAKDKDGNVTFAATEIAVPGQVVTQNLEIFRKPFPGVGRVYGIVRRNDKMNEGVAGVHVGVYSQGYGLIDGYTDSEGRFEFEKVPAGFITILAEEWSEARQSVALDVDLKPNENKYGELIFIMPPQPKFARLTGHVTRENPLRPGVTEDVPGAVVKISGYRTVTADAEGKFTYEDLPLELTENTARDITAWDPATKRVKTVTMPELYDGQTSSVGIHINAFDRGTGTVRVRLLDATGQLVPNYRVILPGFPEPDVLHEVPGQTGVYEYAGAALGEYEVWAVASGNRPPPGQMDNRKYGDQVTTGKVNVLFNGHIAPLTLRLPGQGTVRVKAKADGIYLVTPVDLTYSVWFEPEQMMVPLTLTDTTEKNLLADWAVFTNIPALQGYGIGIDHSAHGPAGEGGTLPYDNAIRDHELVLSSLTTIRGTVYGIDGVTPVANASVRIDNGRFAAGWLPTGPDGRFEFRDQPSGYSIRIISQVTQGGVYRTGFTQVTTPSGGGLVENVSIMLRKRGFVEGKVVYKDYKKYDPDNPANNIPDDTPADLRDNAPVPLASFYLRELDFPQRDFGTPADPMTTDVGGHFFLPSVFVGSLRATAWDSENQELRGSWTGSITDENAAASPLTYIAVGNGGVGSATVTVYDPNAGARVAVPNADVSIFSNATGGFRPFDFTTTGSTGIAQFSELPAGLTYRVSAYSKSVGKTTDTISFSIAREQTTELELELEFKGQVEGTFIDLEGGRSVIPGAHVLLAGSNYSTQASTNTQGRFVFEGVREGTFTISSKDTDTNRRASATRTLDEADPFHDIELTLEPIETLHVGFYLPDDFGNNSNIPAPPIRAEVVQRCWRDLGGVRHCDYERQAQGNPLVFEGVLENSGYDVNVWEPGDVHPSLSLRNSFPKGSASNPLVYVYPAFGEVHVTVLQHGDAVSGARVRITSEGKSVWAYTDGTGVAIAREMPLNRGDGLVAIEAQSSDGKLTGFKSAKLVQTSVPATATITLGSYAGITGTVEAEAGGPSVGTRVILYFGSHVAEARTDGSGRYTFLGIQTPPSGPQGVTIRFIGPDDETPGGEMPQSVTVDDKLKDVGNFKIDATVPRFLSVQPENGALSVSPDATVVVVFSEPLAASSINTSNFKLISADNETIKCTLSVSNLEGGRFAVEMKPEVPATGLPLRSNTLYRVVIDSGVHDRKGHILGVTIGSIFTTTDYAEPRVLKALPASPIPKAAAFEFRFNEPIDPKPWEQGGNGRFHIYKLVAPGGENAAIDNTWCTNPSPQCELKANAFVEPPYNMALFITPTDANPIVRESYYRVVFSGVKDMQGNPLAEQTFHFYSFDEVKPFILFSTPPQTQELVALAEYEIKLDIRDGDATGEVADDVAKVEYVTLDAAGKETPFTTVTKAPFSVKVLAPEVASGTTALRIGAQAYDGSGNQGPKAQATWTVIPNSPPKNVVITPTAAAVYPSKSFSAGVTFEDEGTFAVVSVTFSTPRPNSIVDTKNHSLTVRREVGGAWPVVSFSYTVPQDAIAGADVTINASVTDGGNAAPPATAFVDVTPDTIPPVINSTLPPPQTTYVNAQKFVVEANVSDAETGVQSVTFSVDGRLYATATTTSNVDGSKTFKSVQIETRSKAEDAFIPVVVTAKDYHGNPKTKAWEIFWKGVTDPEAPKVSWLCPVDGAVVPAGVANYALPLRITATDLDLRDVKFLVGNVEVAATQVGTTNEWIATHTFVQALTPGELVVTAVVKDEFESHTVNLPITLDVITADFTIQNTKAALAAEAALWKDKTVLVMGSAARLAPQVPLQLKNLIVVGGAKVETLPADVRREFKVDITTTGTAYVACDSSIDVTSKGYMGGWQVVENERNEDHRGRIPGNTAVGGAMYGTHPSHGGLGGVWNGTLGVTNTPYGSIFAPVDLGAGGPGEPDNKSASGRSGGGAIILRGGTNVDDLSRVVIAGKLLADGTSGVNAKAPGTGGSIWINAKQVSLSPSSTISAAGGEDSGLTPPLSLGGGGGRIALTASEKLDLTTATITAHGGRWLTTDSSTTAMDAGAGTIYFRRPGQTAGELLVTAYDSRFPNTKHPVRPTPIGRIGTGTSTAVSANSLTDATRKFDRWLPGQKIVLNGDTSHAFTVVNVSSDGKTLETDPNDGSLLDFAETQQVPYAGLIAFDKITVQDRAVAVFDDHVVAQGVLNDREAMTIASGGMVVLRYDEPKLTVTSTPADGGSVKRDTSVSVTYSVTAEGGVASVKLLWTGDSVARTNEFGDYPRTATKTVALPVAPTTALGEITLRLVITDRAGREFELPARTFVVVENEAPVITSFTINPASLTIHAGHSVVATVKATDDIAVKNVSFDARLNGTSIKTASIPTNVAASNNSFTVPLANDVPGGSTLVINAAVSDGFAGRAPTAASQTITVLEDTVGPVVNVTLPAEGASYRELVDKIVVRATATDAEVAVKEMTMSFNGGAPVVMNRSGSTNEFLVEMNAPLVDGDQPVPYTVTVTATDYAGNSTTSPVVNIQVRPIVDANAPTLTWACASPGALYIPGYAAKIRVNAVPSNGNAVASVTMTLDDTTPLTVTALANNQYEATFTIPSNAVEGKTYRVRATARAAGEAVSDIVTTFGVVVPTLPVISSDDAIGSLTRTYDNGTLVITGGRVTIGDIHTFDRLIVLGGTVVTNGRDTLNINTTRTTYVACGAAIDVTGGGYAASATHPTATGTSDANGGNHIGIGGQYEGRATGTSYGSVYRPAEKGSGGGGAADGGGVIHVNSGALVVDGTLRANGTMASARSGAGGSIAVTTTTIQGGGTIETNGPGTDSYGMGGGGAIAVTWSDAAGSRLPKLNSFGGTSHDGNRHGAPGSVYTFGPHATYGDLRIEYSGSRGGKTQLPALGSGIAQPDTAGAKLVTDRAAEIPTYFAGHWVEVRNAAGTLKGTWRVASASGRTLMLEGTPSVAPGDRWQGVYRFDNVVMRGATIDSADPIRVANTQTIQDTVQLTAVSAGELVIEKDAFLKHGQREKLLIDVAGEVRVNAGGYIELNGLGYLANETHPDAIATEDANGGNHIGLGGQYEGRSRGTSFGSVYRPFESGSGGGGAASGGGVVKINAGSVLLNGTIRANGTLVSARGGAGGSVWITTGRISGTGAIQTLGGGTDSYGGGGGGAISVTWTDEASTLPAMSAAAGTSHDGSRHGGPGTVYLLGPGATYGEVRIDAGTVLGSPVQLPALGSGTAQPNSSGKTLVITRSKPLPEYFVGHWVEIRDAAGVLKGTWRIAKVQDRTITFAENDADVETGDKWQGVYRFDTTILRSMTLDSADPIRVAEQTLRGSVELEKITAENLHLETGATLKHAPMKTLDIVVAGELRIDSGAAIDVTGLGYTPGAPIFDSVLPADANGGNHIGLGGSYEKRPTGTSFGSVYNPNEHGGAGGGAAVGGGVVRINADTVVINGAIRANGTTVSARGGAGGSIRIDARSVTGTGTVQTNGGGFDSYGGGGGGAIAIRWTDEDVAETDLPSLTAYQGGSHDGSRHGGPGSIYLAGPGDTWGRLRVRHNNYTDGSPFQLPSLGSGIALQDSNGAYVVTDRATNIPEYFVGHWVEIRDAAGALKGTWRIAGVDRKTFTLESGADVAEGDLWQGVYRFDDVLLRGVRLDSKDPIRAGKTTLEQWVVADVITTKDLHITPAATLYNPDGGKLRIQASGEVKIDATGGIELTGRGYKSSATYPGVAPASDASGGSHIGRGGRYENREPGGTYDSVYRPFELGASAGGGGAGGGAVRIDAASFIHNGYIRANGVVGSARGGAGGAIWINTGSVAGTGTIHANGGGFDSYGGGGGGAVALYYTSGAPPALSASGGGSHDSRRNGGAGSIFKFGPSSVYGDVIFNNGTMAGESSALPGLGRGSVVSVDGKTVLTDLLSTSIPSFFEGHWVDFFTPSGSRKGTWRIVSVDGRSFTLEDNGVSAVNVQPGDLWRGVYVFDTITQTNAPLSTSDDVRPTPTGPVTFNDAPVFDASRLNEIVVDVHHDADYVVVPAAIVTDLNPPIVISAQNVRTGALASSSTVSGGFYRLPVTGLAGDTFRVYATDSYVPPATSRPVPVSGEIVDVNAVASVSLQPSSVIGGQSVTGVVRMQYPVRRATGGAVSLGSDKSSADVPALVHVPVGAITATFDVETSSVASTTQAAITASFDTSSQTAMLTLLSGDSSLSSLTLDEPSVDGGTSLNATLTLGAPAPDGGAAVMVTSSDTRLATVPELVVVPEGATTASFTVITHAVPADAEVTITGVYGAAATASATLEKCTGLTSVTPPVVSVDQMWADDALPAGATPASGNGAVDGTQVASGTVAIHLTGTAAGVRTFAFTGATSTLVAGPNDLLVAYALVNPCNPPKQLLLEWKDNAATPKTYRASWGESRFEPTVAHTVVGPLPAGGQWVRLEVRAAAVGISTSTTLNSFAVRAFDGEAWIDAIGRSSCTFPPAPAPAHNPNEVVWFDDALPGGASTSGSTSWIWDSAQAAGGTKSHTIPVGNGTIQHYFHSATEAMVPAQGDVLYTYVLLDPCNPPSEVMLQFSLDNGNDWEHRAYWGEDLQGWGSNGTVSRHRMGPLPPTGEWVRLEVPATLVGLEGKQITGMAFVVNGGRLANNSLSGARAWFDRAGRITRANVALGRPATQSSLPATSKPVDEASTATDGSVADTEFTSTKSESQPYWQVDLGRSYPIEHIDLWNRPDGDYGRMNHVWLLVSDQPITATTLAGARATAGVSAMRFTGAPSYRATFNVHRTGRYVRVQLEGTNSLHIRELQVWAPATASRVNHAIGAKASHTGNLSNTEFLPQQVVDGFVARDFQHTNGGERRWVKVDLGSIKDISTIDLHNRMDCCVDRLANFYVFVSDTDVPDSGTVVAEPAVLSSTATFSTWFFAGRKGTLSIPVNRRGRYVRIQLAESNYVHLAEIQVWGQQPTLLPMLRKGPGDTVAEGTETPP
jgi:hypothetical protein